MIYISTDVFDSSKARVPARGSRMMKNSLERIPQARRMYEEFPVHSAYIPLGEYADENFIVRSCKGYSANLMEESSRPQTEMRLLEDTPSSDHERVVMIR